ncbi:unnamed protein product [Rhizopus microsporus]
MGSISKSASEVELETTAIVIGTIRNYLKKRAVFSNFRKHIALEKKNKNSRSTFEEAKDQLPRTSTSKML